MFGSSGQFLAPSPVRFYYSCQLLKDDGNEILPLARNAGVQTFFSYIPVLFKKRIMLEI